MGKIKFSTKKSIYGVLFVIPCVAVLVFMMLYPLIQTVLFSFSTISLPNFSLKFNGINNFIKVFSRAEVPIVINNTIRWTLGSVIFRLFLGMITALVMNSDFPGVRGLRILVLIPWTVPSIVSANSWRWIFQGDFGVINGMLKAWGLTPYPWIGTANTAMGAILVAATWAGYPFVMMMLLSAMQGLPRDHFEAAMVDGANAFQRFWHIILPGIKPVLLIVLALETINAINAFDMIFNMTGGGPGNATEIVGLLVYRLGFGLFDFAGASAVSVVLILIALFFCVIYILLQSIAGKQGRIKE
jgi:multiple sugar transport system permease protein